MAFAVTNNLEGGSNGTGITAGNSGGASGDPFDSVTGTVTYDSSQSHSGGMSYTPSTAAAASVNWTSASLGSLTTMRGRFYFRPTAVGSASLVIARGVRSGTVVWKISYNGSGKIANQINAGAGQVSTPVLTTNHWYRIEWEFVAAGTSSTNTVNIYDGDSITLADGITNSAGGAAADTTVDEMRFGPNVTYASQMWYDDLLVTDLDFPGPIAPGPSMAIFNQIAVSRAATF